LHPDHPFVEGQVSAAFLERLKKFVSQAGDSADALGFGAYGGFHTCEFCQSAHGVANFGVPSEDRLYVAPELIVHYIEEHDYCPPEEFIKAVMNSPLPESEEYQLITEPFWQLQKLASERLVQNREAFEKFLQARDTAP
jgi:hypothetical protein